VGWIIPGAWNFLNDPDELGDIGHPWAAAGQRTSAFRYVNGMRRETISAIMKKLVTPALLLSSVLTLAACSTPYTGDDAGPQGSTLSGQRITHKDSATQDTVNMVPYNEAGVDSIPRSGIQ
jgi:hypothetical protein